MIEVNVLFMVLFTVYCGVTFTNIGLTYSRVEFWTPILEVHFINL